MTKKILWEGFKVAEPDPYRKKQETKRKAITLIIILPIIFLIEMFVINANIKEDPLITASIFVFFGAIPFMIGALQTMHFSYKILMTMTIIIFIWVAFITLMFWNQAPAPGVHYVTDREILTFVGINFVKTLIIAALLTFIGHAIKKEFINKR
ncbi:MAG: hypothetical protein WC875_05270 [Candidatus Absconditabacterales bacterium]|jgi:hypothetical protein